MSEWDRLPKDWRVALAIVVLTLTGIAATQQWVISIARAEDRAQREAIEEMKPMVRALFIACVSRGECEMPKPGAER